MEMAGVQFPSIVPTAPSLLQAVWCFGVVRRVQASTLCSSREQMRQQKDIGDCIVEGSFSSDVPVIFAVQ